MDIEHDSNPNSQQGQHGIVLQAMVSRSYDSVMLFCSNIGRILLNAKSTVVVLVETWTLPNWQNLTERFGDILRSAHIQGTNGGSGPSHQQQQRANHRSMHRNNYSALSPYQSSRSLFPRSSKVGLRVWSLAIIVFYFSQYQ
jgi:hypothetical protein